MADASVAYQRLIYRIDYLEVPLTAKLRLADKFDLDPYMLAGGYIRMNVNAKDVESRKEGLEFVERWESGIMAGTGRDFVIMQRKIDVRLLLSRAASNTFENKPGRHRSCMKRCSIRNSIAAAFLVTHITPEISSIPIRVLIFQYKKPNNHSGILF